MCIVNTSRDSSLISYTTFLNIGARSGNFGGHLIDTIFVFLCLETHFKSLCNSFVKKNKNDCQIHHTFTTTSKTPLRYKLKVNESIIQQEMGFKYLEIELSGYGDDKAEVREQTTRATKIAGCLNATIWRNKNIGIEAKSRIYKTAIRLIMTYTAETRPETAKTNQKIAENNGNEGSSWHS